jgi:hypothetical protein
VIIFQCNQSNLDVSDTGALEQPFGGKKQDKIRPSPVGHPSVQMARGGRFCWGDPTMDDCSPPQSLFAAAWLCPAQLDGSASTD